MSELADSRFCDSDALHARLRSIVEQPEKASLWGEIYKVTPALSDTIYGDGLRLFTLSSIDSRPNYYVVRGDSSWRVSGDVMGSPDFGEFLYQITDDLEEQFGSARTEENVQYEDGRWIDTDTGAECSGPEEWPAVDDDLGCWSWGTMDWPKGVLPELLAQQDEVVAALQALSQGAALSVRANEIWKTSGKGLRRYAGPSLKSSPERFTLSIDGETVPPRLLQVLTENGLLTSRRPWVVRGRLVLSEFGQKVAGEVAQLAPAAPGMSPR